MRLWIGLALAVASFALALFKWRTHPRMTSVIHDPAPLSDPHWFSDYLEARGRNRALFASTHPEVMKAFEIAALCSRKLGNILTTSRDKNGKTHIGLAPFFLILERSALAAFEALATNQAFQAWVSLRPGVEAVLIVGKWVSDPNNAAIWRERETNPEAYRDAFSGKALGKSILPRAEDIALALKMINDHFLHPNPTYSDKHLTMTPMPEGHIEMRLDFFDSDEDVALGILGILHLVVTIQHSLATMFVDLFPGTTLLEVGLDSLHVSAGEWAKDTAKKGPFYRDALRKMGLWPREFAV